MYDKIKKNIIVIFCTLLGFAIGVCTNVFYNRKSTNDLRNELAEAERRNQFLECRLSEAVVTVERQLDRVRELEATIRANEDIYKDIRDQKIKE